MLQLYDKLLELPLFIGISTDELADIVGQTKFGFYKLVADKSLVSTDDKCTHLFFLMSGTLRVVSHADNYCYRIEEELPLSSPNISSVLCKDTQRTSRHRPIVASCHWIRLRSYVCLITTLSSVLIFSIVFLCRRSE